MRMTLPSSKVVVISFATVVVVGLVLCLFSLYMIYRGTVDTSLEQTETALNALAQPVPAIVLGMGHEPLFDRVDLAALLWQRGYVAYFVATGGQGSDEAEPESLTIASALIAQGVPSHAISQDSTSRNTLENMLNARTILAASGTDQGPIIVVTHHYHGRRAGEIAAGVGLAAIVVTVDGPRLDRKFYRFCRETASYLRWRLLQAPFLKP